MEERNNVRRFVNRMREMKRRLVVKVFGLGLVEDSIEKLSVFIM